MSKDLSQIPARIKEMREVLDIPPEAIAKKLKISTGDYLKYETGAVDISISTLYDIAFILGVDFTLLITGEAPRMANQSVVASGKGISIDRYPGYTFASLAYNYIGRVMEPLLVSIEPSKKPPAKIIHSGQEFNYILSGTVKVTVGEREYLMTAGDSIYFNPQLPHSQEAIGSTASFLTVINEG
ncbi:MAG: cupin domain-containing protein [Oscillospiraceae bacterium]|nr:cupin domain-containing protein [Oscillospiraceae bacterium]